MKIVSWNCNGKLREKFRYIEEMDADIYIIQECEDPAFFLDSDYETFARNYFWTGERYSRGLGVFAKPQVCIEENKWEKLCLRNFLSIRVNNNFDLVAVWACEPYIGEYYIYQYINILNYSNRTVIIGDFNSNSVWDKKNRTRTHGTVVKELQKVGLCSAYHYVYQERQGEETRHTFYLYRKSDRGYHIDHCFAAPDRIQSYRVIDSSSWLTLSDHVPIELIYGEDE